MKINILKFILIIFFLTNARTAWTEDIHTTNKLAIYISQTDTKRLKRHTVDEAIFISREKLVIHSIAAATQELPQFERLELTIDLSATYDNPFDKF